MTFFDTNILVYYTINQDEKKQKLSQSLIFEAIKENRFFISHLVMTEYIFILSKLKVLEENHNKLVSFDSDFKKLQNISTIEIEILKI